MHVEVVVPTFLDCRQTYLRKCVDSILAGTYKDVSITVGVNGNRALLTALHDLPVKRIYSHVNLGWIGMMNRALSESTADAVLYCADDVEFESDCIEKAVRAMQLRFPDGDALVSINQQNLEYGLDTAFGLIGRKFIDRFPGRVVFCPEYAHGCADHEIGAYAKKLKRHFHVRTTGLHHNRLGDEGQQAADKKINVDLPLWRERIAKGILWGESFTLLRPPTAEKKLCVLIGLAYYSGLAGSELYVHDLACELKRLGHNVVITANTCLNELTERTRKAGIKVVRIDELDARYQFDVLHLQQLPCTRQLLAKFPGTPAVATIHSQWPADAPSDSDRVARFIAVRDEIVPVCCKATKTERSKFVVIRNGINLARFTPTAKQVNGHKSVLFAGNIIPIRMPALLDTARRAAQEGSEVTVVGNIYVPSENLPKNVKCVPSTWNIEQHVQACDETAGILLGRTTIEGWACGKPGWIYDIDLLGRVKSRTCFAVPEDKTWFDIRVMAQDVLRVYSQAIAEGAPKPLAPLPVSVALPIDPVAKGNVDSWNELQRRGYFKSHPHYQGTDPKNPALRTRNDGRDDLKLIAQYFELKREHNAAVIGSGYGRETQRIAALVRYVFCIDVLAAHAELSKYLLGCGVTNYAAIPYAPGWEKKLTAPVDFVYSFNVFQHIARAIAVDYLQSFAGRITPQGKMLIQFGQNNYGGEHDVDPARVYEPCVNWTRDEITQAATAVGLQVNRIDTVPTDEYGSRFVWHFALLSR